MPKPSELILSIIQQAEMVESGKKDFGHYHHITEKRQVRLEETCAKFDALFQKGGPDA